jgi:signal transduction histidine kinase
MVIRAIGLAAALGLVIAGIFTMRGDDFWMSWLIATMYGSSIGVPAVFVFDKLRERLGTMRELSQWFVYCGAMLALIAFGSAVTGLALVAMRVIPLDAFWNSYRFGFAVSLIISIPTSVGAATYARLTSRIHASEAVATEARLASLESRVRPHFLFNSLNSAIALIPEDPPRAEQVLERLAALLRFSLDKQQVRLVPLGEELRVVVDYLEIERVRFGERLRYAIDVADELEAHPVPAFALQTLVENSVKYAIAPRAAGGEIRVVAARDGRQLRLAVEDDGPGFGRPPAADGPGVAAPLPAGHGLDTLRARLATLYGPTARLVAPAPGDRTRVELEVPV